MISAEVFGDQPVLTGPTVRLEPLGSQHFEGMGQLHSEPEVLRLTGSRGSVTQEQARQWLATRQDHHDRADWAIVRREDAAVLGEVVLNELSVHDASVNFRILLVSPQFFGRGYGTEATRLAVDYALDVAGLHRISLEVYDFNPRAQRVYEKCGFIREGVQRDALCWDGEWHDAISMSILVTDPRPWLLDGRALADDLLAVRRRLSSLVISAAERTALQRRLVAICDAMKAPGADTAHGARRLEKFLAELDRMGADEA